MNFRKLIAGRIDAYVSNETTGFAKIFTEEQDSMIVVNPNPLTVRYASLLLSRAVPENINLLRKFNLGLKELQEEGKFDLYFQESLEGKYEKEKNEQRSLYTVRIPGRYHQSGGNTH